MVQSPIALSAEAGPADAQVSALATLPLLLHGVPSQEHSVYPLVSMIGRKVDTPLGLMCHPGVLCAVTCSILQAPSVHADTMASLLRQDKGR